GSDRALDEPAVAGAPSRHHHSRTARRPSDDRQSAGAAAQPAEGRVRAVSRHEANKNAPGAQGRFFVSDRRQRQRASLLEETLELLLEARDAAAAIHDLLGAAGPGRVRFGVDIEVQLVAGLTPGGAGLVLGSVGHDDRNHMIIRMNFGFHDGSFGAPAPIFFDLEGSDLTRSITQAVPQNKPRKPI